MKSTTAAAMGPVAAVLLVLTSLVWQGPAAARTGTSIESPALPPVESRLGEPRPEAPSPLDPEADLDNCAACRLASRTSGQLAPGCFQMQPEVLEDGVSLRFTSTDAQVRDALWKSTLARGALVDALRSGESVHLCVSCAARIRMLSELKIVARRIPEGLLLVYTSSSPDAVRHIQAIVHAAQAAPVQF